MENVIWFNLDGTLKVLDNDLPFPLQETMTITHLTEKIAEEPISDAFLIKSL